MEISSLWTYEARFIQNWYCQWLVFVLWNGNGTASFLHSREVVRNGDPLAMFTYCICILLLIKTLNHNLLTSPSLDKLTIPVHFLRSQESDHILFHQNNTAWNEGITPNPLKLFWSWIGTILNQGNCLSRVMVIRCALACMIVTFILGITSTNAIVWKSYGDVGAEHFYNKRNHG